MLKKEKIVKTLRNSVFGRHAHASVKYIVHGSDEDYKKYESDLADVLYAYFQEEIKKGLQPLDEGELTALLKIWFINKTNTSGTAYDRDWAGEIAHAICSRFGQAKKADYEGSANDLLRSSFLRAELEDKKISITVLNEKEEEK